MVNVRFSNFEGKLAIERTNKARELLGILVLRCGSFATKLPFAIESPEPVEELAAKQFTQNRDGQQESLSCRDPAFDLI